MLFYSLVVLLEPPIESFRSVLMGLYSEWRERAREEEEFQGTVIMLEIGNIVFGFFSQ